MDQKWFEMLEHRRRKFSGQTWIPLRSFTTQREGSHGHLGFKDEFLGVVSVAVPLGNRNSIEEITWGNGGLSGGHGPYAFSDGRYKTAESFQMEEGVDCGVHLVLEQSNPGGLPIWYLNQDFILALGLIEEQDGWVRPSEHFAPVAKRERRDDGSVSAIYIRADFLRDYLSARGMALRLLSYRQRVSIQQDSSQIEWTKNPYRDDGFDGRFEGRTTRIHEGGTPEGATTAVFNIWRTDVDEGADIPELGPQTNAGTESASRSFQRTGPIYVRIEGEFWRDEWIEPAVSSPRVRGDHIPSAATFFVDNAGTRMSADDLNDEDIGKWLWFDPSIVMELLKLRTGEIGWYTHDTGKLRGEYGYDIHFGINSLGLINVYAHDIARLSEWHRLIWASKNVYPQGGLSTELAASQIRSNPAKTQAPEASLPQVLQELDNLSESVWGFRLFRHHAIDQSLIASVHRFRAADRASLLDLAKDIARLIVDRLDAAALHRLAPPEGVHGKGSLKSLERALVTIVNAADARQHLTVLVGIYDLRLGSAHLPSGEIEKAFLMAGIDTRASVNAQALQLVENLVSALIAIAGVLRGAQHIGN
jgi:hypothetical protein